MTPEKQPVKKRLTLERVKEIAQRFFPSDIYHLEVYNLPYEDGIGLTVGIRAESFFDAHTFLSKIYGPDFRAMDEDKMIKMLESLEKNILSKLEVIRKGDVVSLESVKFF